MTFDAILTLLVIAGVLVVLILDRTSPAMAVLAGTVVLLLTGVIDADDAFAGFSNSAPLTVAALYVVAAAAARTRVIETAAAWVGARMRGDPRGERGRLARIVVPTATCSAFLNNTPIVAMAIPGVMSWARRTGRSPSRYLMPVSFAAVVGGTVTLIGTSTNLVVSGLMEDAGMGQMGLWEIGKVGLPFAVLSVIVMVIVTPLLLPERRAPIEDQGEDAREFTVEMIVQPGAAVAGRSVAEAGLRNLQGVYLVEIERDGHRISSVRPDEILAEEDRLTFAGNVERIIDLQGITGLASAEERHFGRVGPALDRRLFEAVIAPGSPLVGSTLKEEGFRGRFGGAVIAIHRADERVGGKLGDVRAAHRRRAGGARRTRVPAPRPGPARLPGGLRHRGGAAADLRQGPVGGPRHRRHDRDRLHRAARHPAGRLPRRVPGRRAEGADAHGGPRLGRPGRDRGHRRQLRAGPGDRVERPGWRHRRTRCIEPLGRFGDLGLLFGVLIATIIVTEMISNNAAAVLLFPIAITTARPRRASIHGPFAHRRRPSAPRRRS